MSSRTWTLTELKSEARAYGGKIWRCVEAQHRFSTMRLVDSAAEQAILERVLEESKPPIPAAARGLDFLLFTPFRYDPARDGGSRFRRKGQKSGVFYAAEDVHTTLCERAFWRFMFMADAPEAELPTTPSEQTVFSVTCAARSAIDLSGPPFDAHATVWESLTDYEPCQQFADIARDADVNLLRYTSVRDFLRRKNVALLDPSGFAVPKPVDLQSWRLMLRQNIIFATCELPREVLEFPLSMFMADSRLEPLRGRL
ncbi:MAG: RES family NAD+ phosphorylase [Caulobacteraceae bacterium]